MLKFYNSLTKQIEEFKPINPNDAGLYTCGPTVYNYAHIGNLRTYIFEDILRRVLIYNNYNVKHVMNITDVGHLSGDQDFAEDKMEKEGGSAEEILSLAKKFTAAFLTDTDALNILRADVLAPATEHIHEQVKLIEKLFETGFAYETDLAIYFDVQKFPNYNRLTGQKMEDKKVAVRADVVIDENKKHPADFALWFKLAGKYKNHILRWPSPWGEGFPGWHIECSAMSEKYLGQPFDIHTGGIDHLFPHHTNEIAQSEAAFGKPLANYWLHGEHLLVSENRMGKSEGNFITLNTLTEKGFNPLAYRYLVLTSHYRSRLNFTFESLTAAQNALNNLYSGVSLATTVGKILPDFAEQFKSAVNNDLEMPQAIAVVWNMMKSQNKDNDKLSTLIEFDKVLGLNIHRVWEQSHNIPTEVMELITKREQARANKDFAESDELRKQIENRGFVLEDTASGMKVKKKY